MVADAAGNRQEKDGWLEPKIPGFSPHHLSLFTWRNRGWKSDPHEEARQSLGEVFQIGRLQTPARTDRSRMNRQVANRKADDLAEIDDLCFPIILWVFWGGQQVQTLSATASYFFPYGFLLEMWIVLFEGGKTGYWAESDRG